MSSRARTRGVHHGTQLKSMLNVKDVISMHITKAIQCKEPTKHLAQSSKDSECEVWMRILV